MFGHNENISFWTSYVVVSEDWEIEAVQNMEENDKINSVDEDDPFQW